MQDEQAEAHVLTKQARPMNMQKLVALVQYLTRELKSKLLSQRDTFLFLRDRAFFLAQFLSGERGGDLNKHPANLLRTRGSHSQANIWKD